MKSCFIKYGVSNPQQNLDNFKKQQMSGFKMKKFKTKNGLQKRKLAMWEFMTKLENE